MADLYKVTLEFERKVQIDEDASEPMVYCDTRADLEAFNVTPGGNEETELSETSSYQFMAAYAICKLITDSDKLNELIVHYFGGNNVSGQESTESAAD